MLRISQSRYSVDNLGYLIHVEKEAIAIDPGDPDFVTGLMSVIEFMLNN